MRLSRTEDNERDKEMMNGNQTIRLEGGVCIELVGDTEAYHGIGAVSYQGHLLRGSRPLSIDLRTPDGVQMTDFRLLSLKRENGAVVLEIGLTARPGGPMEWMLHEVRPRVNTRDWAALREDRDSARLFLTLRPVTRQVGEYECGGFSYQYRYVSDRYPLYRLTDRATWEIGGEAVGNEFYLRNAFMPSITTIDSCTQQFSTEWYLSSAVNSSIFQFLPWQTALEGFTQTCHRSANLLTWAAQPAHIRSLFEKQSGCNEIAHRHEHCGDLSGELTTAPLEVLCLPGSLNRVGRLNLYHGMRETVAEALHAQIGLRRERVKSYGIIEEWGLPDFKHYTANGLPKLLEAGVRRIMLPNHFQNNMNVYGVGNMCCTIDYKIADTVGEDNLTNFCKSASAGGAEVEMWGNTALSTFGLKAWEFDAPSDRLRPLPQEDSIAGVLENADDPFVRNPAGHYEADHYAPVFAQLNLRDEAIRAYWLKQWGYAHDAIGISGIFLDSSFNLSSDKFHWIANTAALPSTGSTMDQTHLLGFSRPENEPEKAILSQYHAHLTLMAEMQQLGYSYCGEDIGVFGVHRSGGGARAQIDTMPLWTDCLAEYDAPAIQAAGADADDIYFRGLAYRQVWRLSWDMDRDELSWRVGGRKDALDAPTSRQLALLRVFNAVEDRMRDRTILPGEQGVVYRSGDEWILWAFADFGYSLPKHTEVIDITRQTGIAATELLSTSQYHVYHLKTLPGA